MIRILHFLIVISLIAQGLTLPARLALPREPNPVVNTYNAWGAQTNTGQPSVGSGNFTAITRNYTGQDSVPNTGLLYYNARYYLPSVGRFISPDTIVPDYTDPQYLNRYSYVRNNPIRYNDPTGHCEVVCILAIVAVVLIVAASNPGTAYAPAPGVATPPMPIPCDLCVALDSIPGTGDASDIWALLSGHRLFTGEEQDRRVALAFAVLPIVGGGMAARAGKLADLAFTTPAGRVFTNHGAERSAERMGGDLVDAVIDNPTRIFEQGDGAMAYIKKFGRDSYGVVIQGAEGIVTVMQGKTRNELRGLADRYDWDGFSQWIGK